MVSFTRTPDDISVTDGKGGMSPLKGRILVSVGRRQPDDNTKEIKKTTSGLLQVNG